MGNEGSLWIGMEDFVSTDHMIQNIGDGTYFHSGQLAVTSAVAAGSHMTFKLLYNGAVSMTGGQTPSGQLSPAAVAANLLRQGVTRVIVTTDDTDRHNDWPTEVDVWHRSRLIEAQEVLAATPGVTVLIHDQPCAAELRRDRKRGRAVTPTDRIVIDHRICEGCGDCGRTSNCLSVQAFDTPWGRKTRIDQNSCNLDQSCVDGDCPSFIAVDTEPSLFARLTSRMFDRNGSPTHQTSTETPTTEPPSPSASTHRDGLAIRLTGVGGTGVVTVAQVIGTAAMLDGWSVQGIDQIGLSQKAGPVVSDIRLSRGGAVQASRLGQGDADVLIALDNLVAAGTSGLGVISPATMVVGSSTETPTASMIAHPELHLPESDDIESTLGDAADSTKQLWADAAQITTHFLGDATTANVFVVGMAVQIGALPISLDSLSEAIRVNGAAVEANLTALRLGRLYAAGQLSIDAPSSPTAEVELPDDVIGRCADDVKAHSGARASQRFLDTIQRVRDIDPDPSLELSTAVATHLHQLMTYKDEYEVARLITTGDGAAASDSIADGKGVRYRLLHPPVLAAMGVKRKLRFGPGWIPMFKLLRRARVLRGTPLDIFGYARVRKIERSLPGEYLELVEAITTSVSTLPYTRLVEFARLPDVIRGYEELKESRVEIFRTQRTAALAVLN
jgi:indolepyruvate ferredoxin oxidoreductase